MSKKKIPKFRTEAQERAFWQKHDSNDYIDWSQAINARFPNLSPSRVTISIRLPEMLLNDIKILANKRDVPYQSLIKMLLVEKMVSNKQPLSDKKPKRRTKAKTKIRKRNLMTGSPIRKPSQKNHDRTPKYHD
jgi:predicted DNA binding CopG/RHH family protein